MAKTHRKIGAASENSTSIVAVEQTTPVAQQKESDDPFVMAHREANDLYDRVRSGSDSPLTKLRAFSTFLSIEQKITKLQRETEDNDE